MKKIQVLLGTVAAAALFVAVAYFAAIALVPEPASATRPVVGVCPPGDSGKIDAHFNSPVWMVTAPDGFLISGYCVKAGSANQGLGPEFYTVDPPQKTVTISHSSGKDISHYSVTYVEACPEGMEPNPETGECEEPDPDPCEDNPDTEEDECAEPVEAGVHFQEATCATGEAAVHVTEVEGVAYLQKGSPAPGATVMVTATAEDGFVLVGQSEWEHTFADFDPDECEEEPPPPVEPETPAGGSSSTGSDNPNGSPKRELPYTL